jgi:hypothetical protein
MQRCIRWCFLKVSTGFFEIGRPFIGIRLYSTCELPIDKKFVFHHLRAWGCFIMRSFLDSRHILQISQYAAGFCLLVWVIGCGESGPPKPSVYPVSGTVTGGSGDLAGCIITFNPTDPAGVGATATIGAGGKFVLQAIDGREGCGVGSYKITLSMSPDATKAAMMKAMSAGPGKGGPPKAESPYPEKYQKMDTSDKTVEVKAETNVIDVAL